MTSIDWIIVGFTLLAAILGYGQGFVASALALVGFAAGAFVGSRVGPLLLSDGSHSPFAPLFALCGAIMFGSITALFLEGIGLTIRRRLVLAPFAVIDGAGGAFLLGAVALGLTWITGAVLLQTPGARDFRPDIQKSAILRRLNDVLPPSGPILHALSRVDPFPHVQGPEANVPKPTRGILADRDIRAAARSVVRVRGTACGLAVEGSGWVARAGTVMTNAHVVAGQDDTTVEPLGGGAIRAQVIGFDRRNDLAVLQASGLRAPALGLATDDPVGAPVAILGFPEDGPFHAEPGRLGPTETVVTQDAYGAGPVERRITAIRGRIRSGNSGGPAVDSAGRVAATVFAAARSRERGGFGLPPDLAARDLSRAGGKVGSGPCAH
jgi:hypothetical protein